MIAYINTTAVDRSVVASCLPGYPQVGNGLTSGVTGGDLLGSGLLAAVRGDERPIGASAVAAVAQAKAFATRVAAADAGAERQKKQHLTMWAFRGLEPWRDPT
ncbi:hypothetical protein QNO07_23255 [Streptomyces sp. 549]|uniref:hypothetical protein n=1 Tax=Streptomyces sp. 549 TaxID=3049076 RepID=UPI0024C4620E|nr:hypothetical protein [Streptomyces sp. 549]MDK1476302.1 hypothetical protein [Streptomyces sp. 549]